MKRLLPVALALATAGIMNAAITTVDQLVGSYDNITSGAKIDLSNYKDWYNWEDEDPGVVEVSKVDENTIKLANFPWENMGEIEGTVDFEAKTITFKAQIAVSYEPTATNPMQWDYWFFGCPEGWSPDIEGSGYIFEEDLLPVVATFDDNGNIFINDWSYGWDYSAYGAGYGIYVEYLATTCTLTKQLGEQDITPLLGNYYVSYDMQYLDSTDYSTWYDYSFDSIEDAEEGYEPWYITIVAGEEPNTILLPEFVYGTEDQYLTGVVNMENRTITFPAQLLYTYYYEDGDYIDCYFVKVPEKLNTVETGGAYVDPDACDPVIATFDEDFNITMIDWGFGWDYSHWYGDAYPVYCEYRKTKAVFTNVNNYNSGVGAIVNNVETPACYYDLQGRAIKNADNLPAGLYIRTQNGKSEKFIIK